MALRFAAVLFAVMATWPVAAAEYDTFGDWTVMRSITDTGQDRRVECSAWSGGDGDPTLTFSITDGDVGPPTGFPALTYAEPGFRGIEPRLREDQRLKLVVDDTVEIELVGQRTVDASGIMTGEALPGWAETEAAWDALRAGARARVVDADSHEGYATFSLTGSAAATLRMLDWCGLA